MVNERAPYVASLQRQATSTDAFTAHLPKIDSYDYLLVRSLTVSNQTNQGTYAHVGITQGNVAFYTQTISLASDGYFYKMSGTLVVPRGYSLIIKFMAPNDGDKFIVNASGELISYDK
jgi:hypothetical protein